MAAEWQTDTAEWQTDTAEWHTDTAEWQTDTADWQRERERETLLNDRQTDTAEWQTDRQTLLLLYFFLCLLFEMSRKQCMTVLSRRRHLWPLELLTVKLNLTWPSFGFWPLKMVPTGCTETPVRNHHYSLRNNPEERSSHLLRGGSLTSRTVSNVVGVTWTFRELNCVEKWSLYLAENRQCLIHIPQQLCCIGEKLCLFWEP